MAVVKGQKQVLVTVAFLLLMSGGVRIAIGMGPAMAFAEARAEEQPIQQEVKPAENVDLVLSALNEREQRISERELAIDDRLRALSVAEEELSERLYELQAAEDSLLAALALSETANDDDIARLTVVYENMKPADAVGLFEQMAPEFASGFLVRMQPAAAANIMAGLDPQTAYSVSAIIAGRNANAPTQ